MKQPNFYLKKIISSLWHCVNVSKTGIKTKKPQYCGMENKQFLNRMDAIDYSSFFALSLLTIFDRKIHKAI